MVEAAEVAIPTADMAFRVSAHTLEPCHLATAPAAAGVRATTPGGTAADPSDVLRIAVAAAVTFALHSVAELAVVHPAAAAVDTVVADWGCSAISETACPIRHGSVADHSIPTPSLQVTAVSSDRRWTTDASMVRARVTSVQQCQRAIADAVAER